MAHCVTHGTVMKALKEQLTVFVNGDHNLAQFCDTDQCAFFFSKMKKYDLITYYLENQVNAAGFTIL